MIKIIVFDFDGVIVDSNKLKKEVWFNLFPESDTRAQKIVKNALYRRFGEETRFNILRRIFENFGTPLFTRELLVNHYADKYNDLVQQGIAEKGFKVGILETLDLLSKKYALYINSGTPQLALQESVSRLKIQNFFKGVYGRPPSKEENLKKIMNAERVKGEDVLVVGDNEEDRQSAESCDCHFIGVANEFNGWAKTSFPAISSLIEIKNLIFTL